MKYLYLLLIISLAPFASYGKLNVLTSTTTLKSISKVIAGDKINVDSIAKGPQDPHFVEAKPSYMVKARKADLIIIVGLDLEVGWVTNIIRGSRNSKIRKGSTGYLDTSSLITPINTSHNRVDRSQGDIHALGNPHFLLDPQRAVKVAAGIAERLSMLDPNNKKYYLENLNNFSKLISEKMLIWQKRINKSGVKSIITYHKTFNYFLEKFNIKLLNTIEPKPGIPPSAKHILALIKQVKSSKVQCILVESFFEPGAAIRVKKSAPINIITVPTEVLALQAATTYLNLIEQLVTSIEICNPKKGL